MKTEELPLPSCKDSERAVICLLMVDPDKSVLDYIGSLTYDHFLSRIYRTLFISIKKLIDAKSPCNIISLTEDLKKTGNLDEIGGVSKISATITGFPQLGIETYIERLNEKLALRKLLVLSENVSKRAYELDSSKELINHAEDVFFNIQKLKEDKKDNSLNTAVTQLNNMINVRKTGEKVSGLASGIKMFDDIQGGFQKGQYYVLGGRPSMGKTAFADQVTINILKQGKSVLYLSLESSVERVVGKLACKLAGVSFYSFIRNYVTPKQLNEIEQALNFIQKSRLSLIRPSHISPSDIRAMILKEKRKNDTSIFIMDYLQKVSIPSGWDERRAVSESSMAIQSALVDSGVPGLILVQLNRDAEKESRPRMGHLKESGQIEQDADNIALLWSESDRNSLGQGELMPVTISIEKNKDGASGIDQELLFDRELMTFKEKHKETKNYLN